MAITFLELVNDVLKRLNEVELTSATFGTESNIHQDAKNAVNAALNRLYLDEFEWPFQHKRVILECTPGQNIYPFPDTAKTIAMDSFRLPRDQNLSVASNKLQIMDYEEFLDLEPSFSVEAPAEWGIPRCVIRNRDLSFTLYPTPRLPYRVMYEIYDYPQPLTSWDDTPNLPDFFRWVLHEGAMYHMYTFRGALEEATAANTMFLEGIKNLRTLFINRYEYVRSSMIRR